MSEPLGSVLYVAEPSAQYLVHPPLVIDCSVLAGYLFYEGSHDQAGQRIGGKKLFAPFLLQTEIVSVALKKQKLGLAEIATLGLQQFDALEIGFSEVDKLATLNLALRYKLSAYDAAYLWLAAELKCPLATFDEKLAKAAKEHLASLP